MTGRIGILGVGHFVPADVRTNDWWPAEHPAAWAAARRAGGPPPTTVPTTDGTQRVLAALKAQAYDPFQNSVERRVLAATQTVLDMEEAAARNAIERAGVAASEIDLVLAHTVIPDVLLTVTAASLHERLGLSPSCLTLQADASTYSALAQMAVAEGMLRGGRARYALLVQSSCSSRILDPSDPNSPLLGDGASAMVMAPLPATTRDLGILAFTHRTVGRYPKSLIATVPQQRWFDHGRATIHVGDPLQMFDVLIQTLDCCREVCSAALADAGLTPADVDFFCVHQGTPWLRELAQSYVGLDHARTVQIFERYGYLFSAILPTTLSIAVATGALGEGDVVLMMSGGAGMVYGASVVRWGST